MVSNQEIRRLFSLYAELLLLHNQDEKLAKTLSGAAYYIRRIEKDIITLDKKDLANLFRPETRKLILELQKTGRIAAVDELIQLTPPGLFEMMRIKGLGGKKLGVIWRRAKIDTIEGLKKACENHVLGKLPGFGDKTEKNILRAIDAYIQQEDHFRYAAVADIAERLVESLKASTRIKLISLCGDIRRQATTLARIEIMAGKKIPAPVLQKQMVVQSTGKKEVNGVSFDEIPVTIYYASPSTFYQELLLKTGNAAHVHKVRARIKKWEGLKSEEEIYKKAKLPFVVPEMREDNAEWDFKGKPADLISVSDIRGVVHNHTNWSDGVNTLEDFARACMEKGFEYTVISDHSKNAHYAGGLKEEKLLRQVDRIDALNKELAPFKIFKSVECDIRVSGELDYAPSLLKKLDLVIVSIHQLLKMDKEKATRRLVKAIENRYTTILGHMTGRLLLVRQGYPVDFKKVIDACAANKVVIELNANPYRLDMDWSHIPYALQKGVMISIDPDAHSLAEIDNIKWGVSAARKGGLTKSMTWNAMNLKGIEAWLKAKN